MKNSLISASELGELLGKNTLVIDCRFNLMDKEQGYLQYQEGHIPGAYYFHLERDLSSPVSTHGGRHPLPDFQQLKEKLETSGANAQTNIVVYDDSRMAYAARAWWLFRYMGLKNVRILNGGFKAWVNAKGSLDRREPGTKLGNLSIRLNEKSIVNRESILPPSIYRLIDSRETRRYQGLEEPIDPVAGHIEGAVNFFWQEVTDENGFIKSIDAQKQRWDSLASTDNLVVYCGSGVTACVNLLSLHLCGIDAKLYPGSWSDWCSYLDK